MDKGENMSLDMIISRAYRLYKPLIILNLNFVDNESCDTKRVQVIGMPNSAVVSLSTHSVHTGNI